MPGRHIGIFIIKSNKVILQGRILCFYKVKGLKINLEALSVKEVMFLREFRKGFEISDPSFEPVR